MLNFVICDDNENMLGKLNKMFDSILMSYGGKLPDFTEITVDINILLKI